MRDKAEVRIPALGEDSEVASRAQLRPLPPTAPDGWARWLQIDDPVDLYYDGGWWEVQLMKLPSADAAAAADAAGLGANIADGYGVRSPRYGDEHTVGTERLRPRWRHTMKKTYVKPLQPSDEGAPSAADDDAVVVAVQADDGAAGEQVAVHAVHIPVHSVVDDDADEVVAVPTPEPGSASSSPDPMRKGKGKGSRGTMVTIGTWSVEGPVAIKGSHPKVLTAPPKPLTGPCKCCKRHRRGCSYTRGFLLRCDACDERDLCCEPGEARPRPEKKEKEGAPSKEKEEGPSEGGPSEDGGDEKKEKAPTPKKETAKGKGKGKAKAKAAEKEEAAEEGKEAEEEKPKKEAPPPKKPLSGYLLYCKDKREEFKAANPEAMMPELSKLMGAAWKALTEEESAPYHARAKEDKERYERECAEAGKGKDETWTPANAAAKRPHTTVPYSVSSRELVAYFCARFGGAVSTSRLASTVSLAVKSGTLLRQSNRLRLAPGALRDFSFEPVAAAAADGPLRAARRTRLRRRPRARGAPEQRDDPRLAARGDATSASARAPRGACAPRRDSRGGDGGGARALHAIPRDQPRDPPPLPPRRPRRHPRGARVLARRLRRRRRRRRRRARRRRRGRRRDGAGGDGGGGVAADAAELGGRRRRRGRGGVPV